MKKLCIYGLILLSHGVMKTHWMNHRSIIKAAKIEVLHQHQWDHITKMLPYKSFEYFGITQAKDYNEEKFKEAFEKKLEQYQIEKNAPNKKKSLILNNTYQTGSTKKLQSLFHQIKTPVKNNDEANTLKNVCTQFKTPKKMVDCKTPTEKKGIYTLKYLLTFKTPAKKKKKPNLDQKRHKDLCSAYLDAEKKFHTIRALYHQTKLVPNIDLSLCEDIKTVNTELNVIQQQLESAMTWQRYTFFAQCTAASALVAGSGICLGVLIMKKMGETH